MLLIKYLVVLFFVLFSHESRGYDNSEGILIGDYSIYSVDDSNLDFLDEVQSKKKTVKKKKKTTKKSTKKKKKKKKSSVDSSKNNQEDHTNQPVIHKKNKTASVVGEVFVVALFVAFTVLIFI